jgi:hypothetical protein
MMSKTDLDDYLPPGWEGKYPPCQIQVNSEGELSHDGAPLVHPKVLADIFASVHLEDGRYLIKMDGKTCELEVEDTFFVVNRVEMSGDFLKIRLNDNTWENLSPSGIWLGTNQMIYCRVKNDSFPARFARPAYYQLAQIIKPQGDGFVLELGAKKYQLNQIEPSNN